MAIPHPDGSEQFNLPLQFSLGTVACRIHLVTNAGDDAFPQRGFEARQFVLALRADVDFQARFVRNGITEVPPSIWPMLNVVRGLAGTLVLIKRTELRTRALIGLGMPKSDHYDRPDR